MYQTSGTGNNFCRAMIKSSAGESFPPKEECLVDRVLESFNFQVEQG